MVLTGYLCVEREWSLGYYRKLLPVLLTYLVSGVLCLAVRGVWLGENFTIGGLFRAVLDFSAAPYAWYVEMYIGLFLLSPFLNAAWRALEERARLAMVVTLMAMTALPAVTNLWGQILPDWWTGIYPLTYYVLGAWLREHPVKVKGGWLVAGWLGLAGAVGLLRFALAGGGPFSWSSVSDWGSLGVLGETVCQFSLLSRFTGQRCPAPARWCVRRVAGLSLAIYLMSYLVDQIIYPPLRAAVPSVPLRAAFLPVMVLVSLVCSGLLAQAVSWAVGALMKLLPRRQVSGHR